MDEKAQQKKVLRRQQKFHKLMGSGGIKNLIPLAERGQPNETITIKRSVEYAAIRTPIGARLVLDQEGRLWNLARGVFDRDGREALHLDHPIEITFGPDGQVLKAITGWPELDLSTPENRAYARYLGLI